jgi:predicted HAD superfamily Cof-like phosphohydrolase
VPDTDRHELRSNAVSTCLTFFEEAVPEPAEKNFTTQLGCHFEEVHEHLLEVVPQTPTALGLLNTARRAIHELAEHLKTYGGLEIAPGRRTQYLDALCDQMVTAIGCGHMAKMDIIGAFDETNRSNLSKFVDGKAIFDENRKMAKGPNYTQSDLTPYV